MMNYKAAGSGLVYRDIAGLKFKVTIVRAKPIADNFLLP